MSVNDRRNVHSAGRPALALLLVGALLVPSLAAHEPANAKGAFAEGVVNECAPFLVRVEVDHGNAIYRLGDTLTVTVTSARSGYLYLYYFMADGTVSCLFPNMYQPDNKIEAHVPMVVPAQGAKFRLRIGPPIGWEYLKAVVSLRPLTKLDIRTLTAQPMTEVAPDGIRAVYVQELKPEPTKWAEHHVRIRTIGPDDPMPRGMARRVGAFVGISKFKDKRIRPLLTPHRDAAAMHEFMRGEGGLDEAFLLVDQQATLREVRRLISETLRDKTSPGDTVILYMSTHGARCADDNGDEDDGFDELLVMHDSDITSIDTIRATTLVDDQFGRWLQQLDRRRIIVILDACHSAGQAQAGRQGAGNASGANAFEPYAKYLRLAGDTSAGDDNFLDDELRRIKDIGQRDTVLLAAARPAQIAYMRREADLSVMTYELLQLLRPAAGGVTVSQAHQHLLRAVPAYVEKHFPGATQTPVLVADMAAPAYLKP